MSADNELVCDTGFVHGMIGLDHEIFRRLPSLLPSSNPQSQCDRCAASGRSPFKAIIKRCGLPMGRLEKDTRAKTELYIPTYTPRT